MKITAIVGAYQKGGVVDTTVDALLSAVRAEGAEVVRVDLREKHIEFCTNCRACTQDEGERRGVCPIADDMAEVLDLAASSDGIILASPMNFWTVTALMKRFIERLICFAYWPWGQPAPKARSKKRERFAVIVASSAAPALIARIATRMVGLMKMAAGLLGAKPIGVLFVGLAGGPQNQRVCERHAKKARQMAKKLVARIRIAS